MLMRVRRGPVWITWDNGKPCKVENARLPDGRRVTVEGGATTGHLRYWSEAENGFVEGRVTVEQHDALFEPVPWRRPTFDGPGDEAYAHFLADIESDAELLAFVRTDAGGPALYRVMTMEDPRHLLTNAQVGGGRRSGALVARARGMGETYFDFYGGQRWDNGLQDPASNAFVRRRLGELGWIAAGYEPPP